MQNPKLGKVVGVIQARLSSTRLPSKILAPLSGRPLLQVLVERLRSAPVDEWWLATSRETSDDVTAAWGRALGLRVLRGSLDDVLSRFTAIIAKSRADWVVRVTADAPFMDADTVGRMLEAVAVGPSPPELFCDLPAEPFFPRGYVPELAPARSLLEAEAGIAASEPHHRVHVMTWLAQERGATRFSPPPDWPARPAWRWTVDTPEDLAMAQAAFALFSERGGSLSYPEMVACLEDRPDITGLNRGVRQKAVEEG